MFKPFRLDVPLSQTTCPYLLRIYDQRASWVYGLRKIVTDADPIDRTVIHQPFEDGFPRLAIKKLIAGLHGLFFGVFTVIKGGEHTPFFRRVDSEHVVYGYRNGRFFEEQYQLPEAYATAIKRDHHKPGAGYLQIIAEPSSSRQSDYLE